MPPPPALLRRTELPFLRNYSSVVCAARARCFPCHPTARPNKHVTHDGHKTSYLLLHYNERMRALCELCVTAPPWWKDERGRNHQTAPDSCPTIFGGARRPP